MAFDSRQMTAHEAKAALLDLLSAFQNQSNLQRLEAARADAGNDMIKQMQIVFPLVTKIQAEVIANYGFPPDGEGVVQFIQHVKLLEQQDHEIGHLHSMVKAHFLPPMNMQP